METRSRRLRLAISGITAVSLCMVSSTAIAGGLKSKGKGPQSIMAGFVKVLTPEERKNVRSTPIVSMPADEVEVTGIMVRRNARAVTRREKWFGVTQKKVEKRKTALRTPAHVGVRADKSELIRRGAKALPQKCMNLHTHERSVCLYQAQLKKMNRFEIVTQR